MNTDITVANNPHIVSGLRDIASMMSKDKYRVFGSIIPAALVGLDRRIGDIDLFADSAVMEEVCSRFADLGYSQSTVKGLGNIVGVEPLSFTKGDIRIDIFFGEVDHTGGWRYRLKLGFSIYTPSGIWTKCTKLQFGDIQVPCVYLPAVFYASELLEHRKINGSKDRSAAYEALKPHVTPPEIEVVKSQKPGFYWFKWHLPLTGFAVKLGSLGEVVDNQSSK